MVSQTSLPTYYIGLLGRTVRGREAVNLAAFPLASQITKIPFKKHPEESEDRFSLSLDVSGVLPEDIAVVVDGERLVIEVEKEYQPFKLAHSNWDKCYGVFHRTFEIPEEVDKSQIQYVIDGDQLNLEFFKEGATKREDRGKPTPTPIPGPSPTV